MAVLRFLSGCATALWRENTGSPTSVRRFQRRRLGRLLAHAAAQVPFYRDLYGGRVPSPDEIGSLPAVTKAALMARFDDTIAGGRLKLADVVAFGRDKRVVGQQLHGDVIVSVTSGTTGQVGYFVCDRPSFEELRGTLFARVLKNKLLNPFDVLRFGPWRPYRIGFVTATGGHFVTYNLSLHTPLVARLAYEGRAFSILTPMPQMCRELEAYKPHFVHGYPTFMEALAHEQLQDRLNVTPEVISLGSEPFTATAKQALAAAFPRTLVVESYGTTECVSLASQCRHGKLHINEDVCVLESVDATGKPVPDGTLGVKVLLTNLVNRLQPIIRYELGDQVVIGPPDCACRSPFRTVRVLGRTDDTFFLLGPDGRYHAHTPIPFETLFLDVEGLMQYQLVHEAQNRLRVYFTRDPRADAAALRAKIEAVFRHYLEQNTLTGSVEVAFEAVEEIPRDPNTKKIRQIVSRVPMPTNADELSGPWRIKGLGNG
ncbi:MAG: phenylacetate--CoA ligase family protein [Deltaproteobacteria bacterium]|nr:phenylacetate--CoA ligase family protein [Deltaproteobacteria bacterium]